MNLKFEITINYTFNNNKSQIFHLFILFCIHSGCLASVTKLFLFATKLTIETFYKIYFSNSLFVVFVIRFMTKETQAISFVSTNMFAFYWALKLYPPLISVYCVLQYQTILNRYCNLEHFKIRLGDCLIEDFPFSKNMSQYCFINNTYDPLIFLYQVLLSFS